MSSLKAENRSGCMYCDVTRVTSAVSHFEPHLASRHGALGGLSGVVAYKSR